MGFYQKGMRILPHPDVPEIYGTVTRADDNTFDITWDDGDKDTGNSQTNEEEPDLRVDSNA